MLIDPAPKAETAPWAPKRPPAPARGVGQGAIPAAPPAPLALPQPDWLYNALTVTGPEADLRRFAQGAAGSGVVPWHFDYDQLEETWFLLMLAPPPHRRTISVQGARILARQLQLRDQVWELHEAALGAAGRARACPLDLHSLVPVPFERLAPPARSGRSLAEPGRRHRHPPHPSALSFAARWPYHLAQRWTT